MPARKISFSTAKSKHYLLIKRKVFFRSSFRKTVGSQIYALRRECRMSQKDLADKLHTTQSAIARIENGRQNVSLDTLLRLAVAFQQRIYINFEPWHEDDTKR